MPCFFSSEGLAASYHQTPSTRHSAVRIWQVFMAQATYSPLQQAFGRV